MFKGQRVKITNVTRIRTIFQNAEVTPGTTKTYNLNVVGTITQVYQDPLTSYEVKVDGLPAGQDYIEVDPGELEAIQLTNETNPSAATSIEQLQLVARNQIQLKIWELEERLDQLKDIKAQVETVTDWESYELLIGNINEDDNEALTALNILGNEGQTIRNGDYF